MSRERYILVVEPAGPGPEPTQRLKRGLKLLLRSAGLRCVSVRPADPARYCTDSSTDSDFPVDPHIEAKPESPEPNP